MRNAAGVRIGTWRVSGLPMHYNLRGSFDNQARPFNAISVTVEQKVGPVSFEIAYNHQAQHQNRNDNSFDGPIDLDVNGRPFMDTTSDRKRFASDSHAFRGAATYSWTPWRWMQQLFVASAEYREKGNLNYRLQGYNARRVHNGTARTIDISNDRGRLRVYLDDPGFYSRAIYDRLQFTNVPVTDAVDMRMLGFFASGTDAADGTAWSRSAAASAFASGRYFGGHLQSLRGVRRDESRLWEYRTSRFLAPFNEAITPPKRRATLPGDYTENQAMNQAANTMSGGLTWALTRDINLYGVYSESFRFQEAVNLKGTDYSRLILHWSVPFRPLPKGLSPFPVLPGQFAHRIPARTQGGCFRAHS
jgi:hypothetical protein